MACKQCGKRRSDGHVISFRALCLDCAAANVREAAQSQNSRKGNVYDAWLAAWEDALDRQRRAQH